MDRTIGSSTAIEDFIPDFIAIHFTGIRYKPRSNLSIAAAFSRRETRCSTLSAAMRIRCCWINVLVVRPVQLDRAHDIEGLQTNPCVDCMILQHSFRDEDLPGSSGPRSVAAIAGVPASKLVPNESNILRFMTRMNILAKTHVCSNSQRTIHLQSDVATHLYHSPRCQSQEASCPSDSTRYRHDRDPRTRPKVQASMQ